jgi:hypothetical protein
VKFGTIHLQFSFCCYKNRIRAVVGKTFSIRGWIERYPGRVKEDNPHSEEELV